VDPQGRLCRFTTTASTPRDESRSPPGAELTSVPDEVASTPKESQRAHSAIGNDKFTEHTTDDKCTCKCTGEMMEVNKRSEVNRIPECGWTKHSRCSEVDIEIEDIGTSHTTVSQQAEQVRVVTGQRATQKDDRSRREIVCRRSKSRTELRVESRRDYDYNAES
jgi:hypothetical protein